MAQSETKHLERNVRKKGTTMICNTILNQEKTSANIPEHAHQFTCSPDTSLCYRSHFLPLFLLFFLLLVAYFNSFSGAWVFDDYPNIVENEFVHLKSLDKNSILKTFYGIDGNKIIRPLSYLSFGLNYYIHGLDVFGYHLVNFIIHCVTTLFLYFFIFNVLHLPILKEKYSTRAGSIALLSATLWAIHPIQVTSVTVIVQRMASMAGMFFIMSLFFYLKGRTKPAKIEKLAWFSLCFISGLLSAASKENAVMLPIIFYFFDVLLIQGVSLKKLKRHLMLAFFPAAIFIVLAFLLSNPLSLILNLDYSSRDFTLSERLLTQPRILLFYLSLLIYPIAERFTLLYDISLSTSLWTPWTTFPAIIFWILWTGAGVYLAQKRPLFSFCLLFFIINHLIESSFIPLELIYEHRNYIPSMMLFFLVGIGIIAFIQDFSKKRLPTICAFILLCFLVAAQGHSVIQRNALFVNPLYLWKENAEKYPGLSRVHIYLGLAYDKLGMVENSYNAYMEALNVNRFSRKDLHAVPFNNLGNYYVRTGNLTQAINLYQQALNVDSLHLPSRQGMAIALCLTGDLPHARLLLEQTLSMGDVPKIFTELHSLVLLKQGHFSAAVEESQKILLKGNGTPIRNYKILGEGYMRLEHYDAAEKYWEMHMNGYPDDLESLMALCYIAHLRQDNQKVRAAARKIYFLKNEMSWSDFVQYAKKTITFDSVLPHTFSVDPETVIKIAKEALRSDFK